jgi:hypothetical protein
LASVIGTAGFVLARSDLECDRILNLVGALDYPTTLGEELPAEARAPGVDAERIVVPFAAQVVYRQSAQSLLLCSCRVPFIDRYLSSVPIGPGPIVAERTMTRSSIQ